MTPRNTNRQRLVRAGWVYVAGWLPPEKAAPVLPLLEQHAAEAERIGATGQAGRGRPRKPRDNSPEPAG